MHISQFSGIVEPMLRIQQQIATAKRINRPSDAPTEHEQVLRYDRRIGETDQYLRNIDRVKSYMTLTGSTLKFIQDKLAEARRLALRAANTPSLQSFSAMAMEAEALFQGLLSYANTYTEGQYIFAGQKGATRPFTVSGSVLRSFAGSDLGLAGALIDPVTTPVSLAAGSNQLQVLTRNGTFSTVSIAEGVYTTGASLAAAVQSALDKNPEFRGAGRLLTVLFEQPDPTATEGRLVMRSVLGVPTPAFPTNAQPGTRVSGTNASVVSVSGGAAGVLGFGAASESAVTLVTGATANNGLTLEVDGIQITPTIPAGTYTGAALAAAIQTAINTALSVAVPAPDVAPVVTVSYDADHRLVLTSNSTDPNAYVAVIGGTAQTVLGLAGGSQAPVITYQGDNEETPIIINLSTIGTPGTATTVPGNIPGQRLLMGVGAGQAQSGGVSGGIDILAAVGGLQAALQTGNTSGIQKALYDLNTAQKQITLEEALLGARQNTVELNQSVLTDFKTDVLGFKSGLEDTDYAVAMANLTSYMNALETAVAVENLILKEMSLMEFLK